MKKTIEARYEELRIAMVDARAASELGTRASRDMVNDVATAISAKDWPETRRAIAATAEPMPDSPLRYGCSGYSIEHYHCVNRGRAKQEIERSSACLEQAKAHVRAHFAEEHARAKVAFDTFVAAVVTGYEG